jgi:hypothetical protein
MKFLTKTASAAALTLALLTAPAVAQAYVPTVPAMSASSATVEAGGTVTVRVADSTFEPSEAVTLDVTGAGALGASLITTAGATAGPAPAGAPGTATGTGDAVTTTIGTTAANGGGGLDDTTVRLAATATGPQTIHAWSKSNMDGVSVTVTIVAPDAIAVTTTSDELPATGVDTRDLLGFWVGGGALVLAGGVVLVATYVARHRRAQ